MTDGFYVPGAHDGMASFPTADGLTALVRNHELGTSASRSKGAFGSANQLAKKLLPGSLYDHGSRPNRPCLGATTTLIYDTNDQRLVSHHLSLAGTLRNCGGGPTPWGTWISCEETTERPGRRCARDHGFAFEVQATPLNGLSKPAPLRAMGRFRREAVAVDPRSGIIYQTEDELDGLFYRFIPTRPGHLDQGGRLQALGFLAQEKLDTRNWHRTTVTPALILRTHWIDLDPDEALRSDLRYIGRDRGAARFARGEGVWYTSAGVYFTTTAGGSYRCGQLWRYLPDNGIGRSPNPDGRLELFLESSDPAMLDGADSLTVSPWGDLILCEDGKHDQFLVGVTPRGELYKLARNALSKSEFAGATFSPDGTTLFVNIQGNGISLAITGPWATAAHRAQNRS